GGLLFFPFSSPFFMSGVAILPYVVLIFHVACLMRDQRLFRKALKKLAMVFPKTSRPLAIAVRLTDAEIKRFALEPLAETLTYIHEQSSLSLRWRQILEQFC